jgi:recombinational DNA repair protein (RecF pathway)
MAKLWDKKYYTVKDVKQAGYNLEPLRCRHCGKVGNVVYMQYIGDAQCENCGKWDSEPKKRKLKRVL